MNEKKDEIRTLCLEVIEVALLATKFKAKKPDYRGKDQDRFLELLRRQHQAEEKLCQALHERRQERQDFIAKLWLGENQMYMRPNTGKIKGKFRIGEPTANYPRAKKEKRRRS